MALNNQTLKIFGIGRSKTLVDYVTTEKDVQRGNNRMPLNVARLYEEEINPDGQTSAKGSLTDPGIFEPRDM